MSYVFMTRDLWQLINKSVDIVYRFFFVFFFKE